MSANLQQIAKVLKSNGTDGELVLSFPFIDPEEINTQEPVFIYFDGLPVPFFIDSLVRRGNTKALVHLTDIETYEDTLEIVGAAVYMRECDLGETEDEDWSFLEGWILLDADGSKVGEITSFMDIPSNPCLEVNGDVLVPLHDDLIISIDEGSSSITMTIPEGLFV